MPSRSLATWNADRQATLDEIEGAHRAVGGTDRGRRYATEQINHAYAVLLSSQFQAFCRDLHSESADLGDTMRAAMPRKPARPAKSTPALSVGAVVSFTFGLDEWRGVIVEDRGPIGVGGRRLYGVRFPLEPSPEGQDQQYTELPADRFTVLRAAA